jgi:hypothetical protein
MDKPTKVGGELREFLADAEAIFIEQPEQDIGLITYASALLRVPVVLLGAIFTYLAHAPLYIVLNKSLKSTEPIAAEKVGSERELPVYSIDDHPLLAMVRSSRKRVFLNWILVLIYIAIGPRALLVVLLIPLLAWSVVFVLNERSTALLIVAGIPISGGSLLISLEFNFVSLLFAALCISSFGISVLQTKRRDEHILRRVKNISDSNGFETVCLITGKLHTDNVENLSSEYRVTIADSHKSV